MTSMDNDQQVQVIEARLDALDAMTVSDDQSAREAFTHVVTTVSRINQLSARTQAQAMVGAVGAPVDDVLEKLRQWLDRLLSALKRIVEKLDGAASFSVSVGTTVSVTVDFRSP
jgi:NADH:ubiquinone oxidoreductase subunit D